MTIPMPLAAHEIKRSLEIAYALAQSGVPIFVAEPCAGQACSAECHRRHGPAGVKAGYHLPPRWETTEPNADAVYAWRPGYALCAVGGWACDFLDIDPRNGGQESAEALWQAGKMPTPYATAATPSGGIHHIIQPLGVGKGEVVAGVDLQGGRPDGGGRGFVFIAPTVRRSKVDGVERPYRWLTEPDLTTLAQWRGEQSGQHIASLMPERKAKKAAIAAPEAGTADALFSETHTTLSADRTIAGKGMEVTEAARRGWGAQFRDALNRAAYTLGAYVGSGYMTEEQATDHLCAAIRLANHEPDDNDLRWISEGIEAGARLPIQVVRPSERAARTVGAGGDAAGFFARKLIDGADLDQLEDPEPLVAGWLFKDTVARLVGQPGSYKSFVSLDMALCVALGRPWHGRPVQQTPVLYVVGEGLPGYKLRRNAWCEGNGVDPAELRGKILFTRGSIQIGGEDWDDLAAWVLENDVKLIVIDTQARATVGYDENSSTEQGQVIERCHELRAATKGVLLLVHHTGHANGEAAERGRGSSAWRAAVDTELLLRKTGELAGALVCDRQKDAESGMTVAVAMAKAAGSLFVQIGAEAPLSPRSQWIVDQVAKGTRFASANAMVAALREAGHKIGNTDKADVFEEYGAAVREATGDQFDPNTGGSPRGGTGIFQ